MQDEHGNKVRNMGISRGILEETGLMMVERIMWNRGHSKLSKESSNVHEKIYTHLPCHKLICNEHFIF